MSEERWAAVDEFFSEALGTNDPLLRAALVDSQRAGLPPIHVSPNQGKFLQLLAEARGARRILEIGTLGGYSSICLARSLPSGGVMISLELDANYAEVARKNLRRAGCSHLVTVVVGPALQSLEQLVESSAAPFDLIFIDADKVSYPEYFTAALALSRVDTVIVADNVVRKGALIDSDSSDANVLGVRRMLELIASESRVAATAIQTVGSKGYDGFVLARVIAAARS